MEGVEIASLPPLGPPFGRGEGRPASSFGESANIKQLTYGNNLLAMTIPAKPALSLMGIIAALWLLHLIFYVHSEPFYNHDEARHVMTGVFFRDFVLDMPVTHPRAYTVQYYLQYPALGLLVWPPFFYVVEGLFMLLFGTSVVAAKLLIGLVATTACVYLFLLVTRTHSLGHATIAVCLFGVAPLVVVFSRQVMLEMPTLALALAAIYHFQRYLDVNLRRDLWLASLASAFTALTRFDGVFLLVYFVIIMLARKRLDLFRQRQIIGPMLLALALVLPVYGITAKEFGFAIAKAATEGTSADSTGFLRLENLWFYPACIPQQLGWFAAVAALAGLTLSLTPSRRAAAWPYLAMAAATYLAFTPFAEPESRHAIYWVPAFAFFAADGIRFIGSLQRRNWLTGAIASGVVVGTGWFAWKTPPTYVRGYEAAAEFVIANTKHSPACLFDSFLNGDFIYQVRRHDPDRHLCVLRGDKLFYGVLSDPHAAYAEFVKNQQEILDLIYKYDPEYIVVEDPQVYFDLPMGRLFRQTLHDHPQQFERVAEIPIESNLAMFREVKLVIYYNRLRNPNRVKTVEFNMLGLQRSIQGDMPNKTNKK